MLPLPLRRPGTRRESRQELFDVGNIVVGVLAEGTKVLPGGDDPVGWALLCGGGIKGVVHNTRMTRRGGKCDRNSHFLFGASSVRSFMLASPAESNRV